MGEKNSLEFVFYGQVQGVGFRFTTSEIAERYDLDGWVRNRSDGKVELAVRGADLEINRFIDEIVSQSRLSRLIDGYDSQPISGDALAEISGFSIRR